MDALLRITRTSEPPLRVVTLARARRRRIVVFFAEARRIEAADDDAAAAAAREEGGDDDAPSAAAAARADAAAAAATTDLKLDLDPDRPVATFAVFFLLTCLSSGWRRPISSGQPVKKSATPTPVPPPPRGRTTRAAPR